MEKEAFYLQCKAFTPVIKKIIEGNVRFYRYRETIKWTFDYDEDASIMATCNRKTNVITANLKSVIISYNLDDLKNVEYYLLHEIRHVFQHSIIKDYKDGLDIPIDDEIVKKWINEGNNYIKPHDENGNENPKYFLQDSEMDAYAFSYSVMKYKYKNTSNLYVPPVYGNDFYDIVNDWLTTFSEENL